MIPTMRPLHLGRPVRPPNLGVPWDRFLGIPDIYGDLVRIAGHSAMAAVGIYAGLNAPGAWSIIGWIVGVGSGVCALLEIGDLGLRNSEASQ